MKGNGSFEGKLCEYAGCSGIDALVIYLFSRLHSSYIASSKQFGFSCSCLCFSTCYCRYVVTNKRSHNQKVAVKKPILFEGI